MDKSKKRQLIFNLIIVILVLLVVILIDLLIVNLRSSSGDFKEEVLQRVQADSADGATGPIMTAEELAKIEPGEKVFVPILNFHHIDKSPVGVSRITASYYIEPEEFEMILQNLIAYNYETFFLSEIIDLLEQGIKPPDNILAITFDDGNISFYDNAWPILRKYKLKSNVYIMTGVSSKNYLDEAQIIEVVKDGFVEVGSHTVWHPKLTKSAPSERLYELEKSKDDLESLLSRPIEILAYPFGLYDQDVKALAKAVGYKAGLTFDQEAWQDPTDLFELKRISVWPKMNVVKLLEKLKSEE